MTPIFHLSIPVSELDEAIAFYVERLGGVVGRRHEDWADVAVFGAQLTLQRAPADVTTPMPRTRHFGATLAWPDWEFLTGRLGDFIERPTIKFQGSEREQAKAMLADPSGNFIEIKAYRSPDAILGSLATETA